MPTVPLPQEPSLEQLRKQAKDLRRAVRAGEPAARAETAEHHPDALEESAATGSFPLRAAQLVVARRYGFASWARLKRHVETVGRFSRFPARMEAMEADDTASLPDVFLRLACLSYEDDRPEPGARRAGSSVRTPR